MSSLENGQFEEGREDLNEVVDTLPSGNEETRVCRVECFISVVEQTTVTCICASFTILPHFCRRAWPAWQT